MHDTVTIERIPVEHKSVLRQLMELYDYDFSEYSGADVNEHGLYGYGRVDHYWTAESRIPYFIKVGGKHAGFVLVGHYVPEGTTSPIWAINEFFIMRKYRRRGIGTYVACRVFDMHRGSWQVSQVCDNDISLLFWERVISDYTNGAYEKRRAFRYGFDRQFITFDNSP